MHGGFGKSFHHVMAAGADLLLCVHEHMAVPAAVRAVAGFTVPGFKRRVEFHLLTGRGKVRVTDQADLFFLKEALLIRGMGIVTGGAFAFHHGPVRDGRIDLLLEILMTREAEAGLIRFQKAGLCGSMRQMTPRASGDLQGRMPGLGF